VDTSEKSRRRWWKKKRTWAAALWLAVAYPLSCGPATWAGVEGVVPPPWVRAYRRPAEAVLGRPFADYVR